MRKKIQLIVLCLVFVSCATYEVNYKNLDKFESTVYPEDKTRLQRFYLIGDTGYEKLDSVPLALHAFRKFAKEIDTQT